MIRSLFHRKPAPPALDAPTFTVWRLLTEGEFEFAGLTEDAIRCAGGDNETPITVGDVLLANGWQDAIWCLNRYCSRETRTAAMLPAMRRIATARDDPWFGVAVGKLEANGVAPAGMLVGKRHYNRSVKAIACAAAGDTKAFDHARRSYPFQPHSVEMRLQEDDLLAAFPPLVMKKPWWWRWR